MELNIVGKISRSDVIELDENASEAQFAQVNEYGFIQMFYKKDKVDRFLPESPMCWQYLSYCGIWQGSSDDMYKKKLLEVIE